MKPRTLTHRIPDLMDFGTPVSRVDYNVETGEPRRRSTRERGVVVSALPGELVIALPAPGGARVWVSRGLDLDRWEVDLRERMGAARAALWVDDHWDKLGVDSAHDLSEAMGRPRGDSVYGAYVGAGQLDQLTLPEQQALREVVLWAYEKIGGAA